jgi:uncharacterized protein with PIN domain
MIKIEKQIHASLKIEIQADDIQEAVKDLSLFNELPAFCPRCEAPVTLHHREHNGNDYYEARCEGEVIHKSNLGTYRDGKRLYWKNDSFKTIEEIRNNG